MALSEDILKLRDQTLADPNAAHDYYTDTKIAWRIVHEYVDAGHTFTSRNMVTGTETTHVQLAGKAPAYISGHLAEATFQQFIAIFESFFFDVLRLWLRRYPGSLIGRKVDFRTILRAADKSEIIASVINRNLDKLLYKRPLLWFQYLNDKAKLGCPTADEVDQLAEAKATRDVLVHNQGIAGSIYESKAGKLTRCKSGDRIDVPGPHHRETWQLIRKIVTDISDAAIAKAT